MAVTLHVGNLSWTVTEDDMAEAFGRTGRVVSVRIVVDRVTQRSLGYGFVEVEGPTVEQVVEAMDGVEVRGRRVSVTEARSQEPRPPWH